MQMNTKQYFKFFVFIFLVISIIIGGLVLISAPFFNVKAASNEESINQLRENLKEQIRQKQKEINKYQEKIQNNKEQAQTLQNQIDNLEDEISKVQAEIQQLDLNIKEHNLEIDQIDEKVDSLETRINTNKKRLKEYIQTVAYNDKESLLEIVLKNENFSDFFDEFNALESVQGKIHATLEDIKSLKEETEEEKKELEKELTEMNKLKSFQMLQKRTVKNKQSQREQLLSSKENQNQEYSQEINEKKEEISSLRERLTLLDNYNLTEDQMIHDAIVAAGRTSMRPAFLLGVLEMESRLGQNVGSGNWEYDMYQCYKEKGWITYAEKLKNAFVGICNQLGIDPDSQPVSARPSAYSGCGGAMGIAQFMPTTWMGYKDEIMQNTDGDFPNPWKPEDAFTAAATKLARDGANMKNEEGERRAYSIYLSGGTGMMYHAHVNKALSLAEEFRKEYPEVY
jgi:peptidoglycan hydrolase CwlO-like protein